MSAYGRCSECYHDESPCARCRSAFGAAERAHRAADREYRTRYPLPAARPVVTVPMPRTAIDANTAYVARMDAARADSMRPRNPDGSYRSECRECGAYSRIDGALCAACRAQEEGS